MATPARADPASPTLHVAEPPAQYLRRPGAVVDASLIAALLFAESGQGEAQERLSRCMPAAPDLLPYEIADVAVGKIRRGAAATAVRASLDEFTGLDIELHPVEAPRCLDIASRYGLTAYDAAYLALASDLRVALYTFDRRLADAAREHFGQSG